MRSRWWSVAAALVVAVGLSGCVGIPTGGGVQDGGAVVSGDEPDIQFAPEDPTPGSDPEQLLRDYLLALAGPQNGYEIARKYLTSDFANVWDPNAITTIRSGSGEILPGAEGELLYRFASRASVDPTGRYSEQPGESNQTLAFGFEQEDGEWRINRAPDGIVLSKTNFDTVFEAQPLYFLDPSSKFLVPDVRWFPLRGTFLRRVAEALLEGPADWLTGGVVLTGFPEGTALVASDPVVIDGGVATVTLTDAADSASAAQRAAMRQQLAATLGVSSVVLKVGPLTLDSPDVGPPPVRPQAAGQAIVGTPDAFGFASGGDVSPLDGFSEQLVAAAASAVTVGREQRVVAYLAAGTVSALPLGDDPILLDARPGLIAPSIDSFDFIWAAQGSSAASIVAWGLDGERHEVATGLSADTSIVSMDLSRDGTRVLLTVMEPLGPRIYVAGVLRDAENAPTGFTVGYGLDIGLGTRTPIDATWMDERSVAVLSEGADGTEVTAYEVGGPSASLGNIEGGTQIVGGNFGAEGIRVLAGGEVWQHRASGWINTGIEALYLATQQ
jgi:hypothetical protein